MSTFNHGNSSNLTISNSALWADLAHPINIGTHSNADDQETMSGVNIFNIDIMHHKESQIWYQGTIAINPGDENTIENVHVQNVRVEEIVVGQLVNLRVDYNAKYNAAPGRAIRNVYVEDMTYLGTTANPSLVLGYDDTRLISNVTFRGLVVDSKAIYDDMEKPAWYYTADFVPMFVNEHVNGLNFTQG